MARFLGRDDDFRVLNYGTSGKVKGKTPRRLSNTNNPFTFGSAEALTQLLVSLMPASDGPNSIFADKAQALISGVMYALVDLRDKGVIKLSTSIIRDSWLWKNAWRWPCILNWTPNPALPFRPPLPLPAGLPDGN